MNRYVVRALKMLLAFERNKGQRWPWTLVISVYLLISFCSTSTNAFNVDVNSKVIHQAPGRNCVAGDCMFGFSVAQHREQGQPWLLVGAPTADSGQPEVDRGGAVFKCKPDNPGQCDLIPFDTKGNTVAPTGQQYDKKSGQWFGSLVRSSGDNGVVLACAPRYVYYVFMGRMDPVGMCFSARKNFSQIRAHRPCVESAFYGNLNPGTGFDNNNSDGTAAIIEPKPLGNRTDFLQLTKNGSQDVLAYMICNFSQWETKQSTRDHCDIVQTTEDGNILIGKWGYHRQGSCQAGLGAAIAENNDQVYVGAVGSWYWQGQVFSQKLLSLREQHKTAEGSPSDDDSYLGYSVATGEFNGDNDNADVVVGMPRGANLTGKVVLYTSTLENIFNMTGDQIGAYYGYSVASGDLNGDGLDDVIVGAPMWSNFEVMGKYETGRVYVYYQHFSERNLKMDTLDGMGHKSRFGLSVACAGNLNLDGKTKISKGTEDLIVGAPYDGPDHQGAVYIYLGGPEGVNKKYAQVIFGKDVNSQIQTFGWSLSAGMDLDNNEYPDLLVGAYESNNAVFLKSAPVVHLNSEVRFLKKQVNLNHKPCAIKSGTMVPCVDVEVTLKYDGVGVPEQITLELNYILDAKKEKTKRLFFLEGTEQESERTEKVTIRKGQPHRETFQVHLPASAISDKLTSIDIQVGYSLAKQTSGGTYGRQRRELAPVLGHDDRMATDTLSIQKNCGSDNVCIPNLSVSVKHDDTFIWTEDTDKNKFEITADIYNDGEDAFNAFLYLTLPKEIQYISATDSSSTVNILCSPPSSSNNRTIECDIGNPLPARQTKSVKISLRPEKPTEAEQEMFLGEYAFFIAVNSSNPENDGDVEDNQADIRIPLTVTTDWKVSGISEPASLEYNISDPFPDKYLVEDQIGPEVIHTYQINNKGPSAIKEAEVFILWPSFTKDDQRHLLYLFGVSSDPDDKVVCQSIPNINPLYLKTTESKGYAEKLQEALDRDAELGIVGKYYPSSKNGNWSIGGGSSSRTGSGYYSSSYSSSSSSSGSSGSGGYYQQNIGGSRYNYGSSSSSRGGNYNIDRSSSSSSSSITTQTKTSSSKSSSSSSSGGSSLGASSGWKLLENGTYIRIYDSRSTGGQSGGSSFSSYNGGSSSRGGETKLTGQGSLGGGLDLNLNTIVGAAKGPGGYHGTMKKSELEKEAGGSVFSSTNQETRHQVENTRYQGGSLGGGGHDGSISSSSSSRTATDYGGEEYDQDDYDYSSSSRSPQSFGGGSGYSFGMNSGTSSGSLNANTGGGHTRYEEGSYFDLDHRDMNGDSNGRGASATGSTSSSSSSSSKSSSGSSSGSTSTTGRWVWSEASQKWEWSDPKATTTSGMSSDMASSSSSIESDESNSNNFNNNYDQGSSDSGWIMLPNGTQVRTQSSWSTSSYSSSKYDNNNNGGRRKPNGRRGSSRPSTQSGSSDSGWVQLANGTMVRRQRNWSRTQYETSYGGVQLNPEDRDQLAAELGHGEIHDNNNDVKKPWLADLDELQRKVDAKARALPSNVEPGFEDQYLGDNRNGGNGNGNNHRVKRQLPPYGGAFDNELVCDPESCTMIRCTVGPLGVNEGVVFKVRSRLFKQTQVEKYSKSVQIASKLVTRITKLPYMANPMSVSYQTYKVKTEVFPSEMGEESIPWWVWLVAALLGLLLLTIIVICLKKCGFFKRKRPDNSPEREPLNGYH